MTANVPALINTTNLTVTGITSTISENIVTNVEYSLDNGTWTSISGPYDNFTFNLTGLSEGAHNLRLRATDDKGTVMQESAYLTKTFTVDTTLPDGTITINNGAETTNQRLVTANLTASPDTRSVQLSENKDFNGAYWIDYFPALKVTLMDGEGTKYLWVRFKDLAGNVSTKEIYDTIEYNTGVAGALSKLCINPK